MRITQVVVTGQNQVELQEAELDLSPPLADLGAALAATGLGAASPGHFSSKRAWAVGTMLARRP